jgi:hypothetical protein
MGPGGLLSVACRHIKQKKEIKRRLEAASVEIRGGRERFP